MLLLSVGDVDVFSAEVCETLRSKGYLNLFSSVTFTRSGQIDNVGVMQLLRCAFDHHRQGLDAYSTKVNAENEKQAITYLMSNLGSAKDSMGTSLDEDKQRLKELTATDAHISIETILALQYRIEKKQIIDELLHALKTQI